MTKAYEIKKFYEGKTNLIDWRSNDLGLMRQPNCKGLVRSLWEDNLLSIPMMKTVIPHRENDKLWF